MVDVLSPVLVAEQMVITNLVVVMTNLSGLGRGRGDRKRNRPPLGNEDSLRPQHPNLAVPEREALLKFGEGQDIAIDLPQIGPSTSHHMRHQIDVGRDTMGGFIESKNEPAVAEDGR